jgi:hypothetical protein
VRKLAGRNKRGPNWFFLFTVKLRNWLSFRSKFLASLLQCPLIKRLATSLGT